LCRWSHQASLATDKSYFSLSHYGAASQQRWNVDDVVEASNSKPIEHRPEGPRFSRTQNNLLLLLVVYEIG